MQGVGKARHLCEKHLFRDYENSPKRLFSYIKRLSKRIDGISPHLTRKNPFIWTRSDNEEALSRYFRKVSSTNIGEQPTINFDDDGLPTDPVVVEKGAALQAFQHHEPDKSSGLDSIHFVIMKAQGNLIAELLLIMFNTFLQQFRPERDWKDEVISPVYKAGCRGLFSCYGLVSLTSFVVKLME